MYIKIYYILQFVAQSLTTSKPWKSCRLVPILMNKCVNIDELAPSSVWTVQFARIFLQDGPIHSFSDTNVWSMESLYITHLCVTATLAVALWKEVHNEHLVKGVQLIPHTSDLLSGHQPQQTLWLHGIIHWSRPIARNCSSRRVIYHVCIHGILLDSLWADKHDRLSVSHVGQVESSL